MIDSDTGLAYGAALTGGANRVTPTTLTGSLRMWLRVLALLDSQPSLEQLSERLRTLGASVSVEVEQGLLGFEFGDDMFDSRVFWVAVESDQFLIDIRTGIVRESIDSPELVRTVATLGIEKILCSAGMQPTRLVSGWTRDSLFDAAREGLLDQVLP